MVRGQEADFQHASTFLSDCISQILFDALRIFMRNVLLSWTGGRVALKLGMEIWRMMKQIRSWSVKSKDVIDMYLLKNCGWRKYGYQCFLDIKIRNWKWRQIESSVIIVRNAAGRFHWMQNHSHHFICFITETIHLFKLLTCLGLLGLAACF